MKADEYTRALLDELCVHANQKNVGGNTYKFDCTRCTQEMFITAQADARAAGYAEAIEEAAQLLDVAAASIHPELQLHGRYDAIKKFATSTAGTVRKLAPATTKEPK